MNKWYFRYLVFVLFHINLKYFKMDTSDLFSLNILFLIPLNFLVLVVIYISDIKLNIFHCI